MELDSISFKLHKIKERLNLLKTDIFSSPSSSEEFDKRFFLKETLFKSPPLDREIIKTIKLIAPHYNPSLDEKSRRVFEKSQNAGCWSEDEVLSQYLFKMKKPLKILEIGPGLGRSVVFLTKKYHLENSEFHLYEGEGEKTKYTVLGSRFDDSFCGNISVLKRFLEYNGLNNYKIFQPSGVNYRLDKLHGPYDVIYSFYAIGFHWSLEYFIDEILKIMHEKSLAFFIVHRDFKEFDKLKKVNYRIHALNPAYLKNKGLKMLVIGKNI